jgi:hypothetical protein
LIHSIHTGQASQNPSFVISPIHVKRVKMALLLLKFNVTLDDQLGSARIPENKIIVY